ncbi:MAG: SLC13 family permease [Candidatus Krumholzibacteriota bacterium]|nr:SLC13 family permease [Candidatus Krumholzibacteriota bacterium]
MEIEILTVLAILTATVVLLIFEVFRIDFIAILCMLALGWTGILTPGEALSGFSSNAVIAMMAVMIMGNGLAKTGIMNSFSAFILRLVGSSKRKLIGLVSLSVGLLSAFMQNVGAAALFLPAVLHISKREKIPASELIMPLGFAAILGGTLTMVASGPLILLNDLLRSAGLQPYGLFGVTPAGLILLATGILFFFLFGSRVLPHRGSGKESVSHQKKLIDTWHLPFTVCRYSIPENSLLVGLTNESSGVWSRYSLHILAVSKKEDVEYAPWRNTRFETGHELALLGDIVDIERFAADFQLRFHEKLDGFERLSDSESVGFAEIIIPPRSSLIGRTLREVALRKQYSVEPVLFFRSDNEVKGDFSDQKFKAGDTLVVHGLWENVQRLKMQDDFVVITPFEIEEKRKGKAWIAGLCFAGSISLTIAGFPISFSLFSGAVAMVLTRVIRIDELYKAVEWKVVFLIAGLIPLGMAMQKTGAAEFLAIKVMGVVQGGHPVFLLATIAVLSTLFSLFMSNVASTVVLAPLVINMARIGGLDPRPLVLLVAVCAANSFVLPTHQVNAMLLTPGGYKNSDYFKAGGGMTILFLVVVVSVFYLLYM